VRNLGGLTRARTCPGRLVKAKPSPSMYADEKSDEAVVPRKRPNKGRQLPAESWRKGLTRGEQPTGGRGSDTEPRCHVVRLAAVRRSACSFKTMCRRRLTRGGSPVVSSARQDLCGGRGVILVPTATLFGHIAIAEGRVIVVHRDARDAKLSVLRGALQRYATNIPTVAT